MEGASTASFSLFFQNHLYMELIETIDLSTNQKILNS